MRYLPSSTAVLAAVAVAVVPATSAAAQATAPEAAARAGWVPASTVRSPSGRPGPAYWQQRVDYRIDAELEPATDSIRATGRISYHNRSPDPLDALWLHLEQNICAPGSVANLLDQPPLVFLSSTFDFSCQGFAGGFALGEFRVDGVVVTPEVLGTVMRLPLPRALSPGGTVSIDLGWRFKVPPYGAARMGHDGLLYEIAQWYPRLAVYDDVRGWNHEPYTGAGEFYLEYGRFDVAITLPAGFVVAATGVLQNPADVLTPTQRERLARARTSDSAVAVISAEEAGTRATRLAAGGPVTWRFSADSVRDFAFAAAPDFRWDASGYDGILIHTYYRPTATLWPEANRMAREAVKHFSERWLRYPYPHASSVEGPIEGMEYPMLAFDPSGPTREDLQWVVAHELGHQWVPMVVGSNERLYPWMDEGFNTFIDLENAANYFAGTAYGDTIAVHPLRLYRDHAIPAREQPLITRPVESRDLFWTGYQKPALMLSTLRNHVLGPERFDPAFRAYLAAWAFRHPTPADFFRIMRDRTGVDLDWFWRDWVYTVNRPDQALESVEPGPDGARIVVANRGTMQLPIFLRLTFEDGTIESVMLPVDAWNQGPRHTRTVKGPRRLRQVELDPDGRLPDDDRANNVWRADQGAGTGER